MTQTMTILLSYEELANLVAEHLAWKYPDLAIVDVDLGIEVTDEGAVEIDVEIADPLEL